MLMSQLFEVVRSVAMQPSLWSDPLVFNPVERWSRLLYADDMHDVWLLTWLPGQGTDLHAHDGSAAAFTVLRGALVESRPDSRGRLRSETLPLGFSRWVAPHAIHEVRNDERFAPAVSVHAYSPPLQSMTSYEHRHGRLVPTRTEPIVAATATGVA